MWEYDCLSQLPAERQKNRNEAGSERTVLMNESSQLHLNLLIKSICMFLILFPRFNQQQPVMGLAWFIWLSPSSGDSAGGSPQRRCKCFSLGIRSNHVSGKRGEGGTNSVFLTPRSRSRWEAGHAHLLSDKHPQEHFVLLFLSLFC